MATKRVLCVGQCGPDQGSISRVLQQHFLVQVVPAHDSSQALEQLRSDSFDLVLVNRVFDADGSPGIELIQELKSDPKLESVPVMLVSNYATAQDEAVQAGALPGFGKDSLHAADTLARLRAIL